MNQKLTFGSLFSGIGGMDIGLERCGMTCKWQVEIDNYATKILEKHWPDVKRYKDIKDIKKIEYVDVIAGGFPCQNISNAGKREGIEGEKSGLWKEFYRIICLVRPKYVLVENVSALLARGMDTVLAGLSQSGYDSEWDCLPASSIGAPHRRDRVFIIAYSNNRREQKHKIQTRRNSSESGSQNLAYCEGECSKGGLTKRNKINESKIPSGNRSWTISNRNRKRIQIQTEGEFSTIKFAGSISKKRIIVSDTYDYNYWKQCQKSIQKTNRQKYWSTDAGILRVAYGISNRIHRIKCLGNAVVPQVAEFIGKRIIELNEQ